MDTYRIKEEYHKLFHAPHMNRIWVKSKLFDWFEDADDEDVKIHQATIEMFEKVEERIHLRRVPESHDICKIIGGDIKVFGNKDMIIMEKAINGDMVEKPVKLDGNFKITNNTEQTFFVNADNSEILITELNSNKQPKTFTEDDVITLHWEYEKELLNTNPIPFNQWIKQYKSSGAKNGSVTDNESMIDGSLTWPKTVTYLEYPRLRENGDADKFVIGKGTTTDTAKIDISTDDAFNATLTTCESNESITLKQEDINKLRYEATEEQQGVPFNTIPNKTTFPCNTYTGNLFTKDQVIEMVSIWVYEPQIRSLLRDAMHGCYHMINSFKEHINSK